MHNGYIALHRKILENPIVCKDTEHMAVWIYLLLNATHTNYDSMFKGERVTLKPGQLLTGRKSIAAKLKINESKVQRILKTFESEQQIEQVTSNQNRLITIIRWNDYQKNKQPTEQPLNNERTTSEQPLNTNNNVNKVNNVKNVYGEFVLLTDKQYIDLLDRLTNTQRIEYIERLDNYIGSTGTKYKSHYHTILNWYRKDNPIKEDTSHIKDENPFAVGR